GEKEENPGDHREAEPEEAGPGALLGGKLVDEDRDEDDVVDPEDDLHHEKGDEGDPGLGTADPGKIEGTGGEKGDDFSHVGALEDTHVPSACQGAIPDPADFAASVLASPSRRV